MAHNCEMGHNNNHNLMTNSHTVMTQHPRSRQHHYFMDSRAKCDISLSGRQVDSLNGWEGLMAAVRLL